MEMNGVNSPEAATALATAPASDKDGGSKKPPAAEGRLVSLDFFRSLTMFMLIGEATGLYELLRDPSLHGTLLGGIGWQLEHHPWNGLHSWDLVQPFFMFIVGVAMPFSIGKRWARGDSWRETFRHALTRSALLLFFGWALYCIGPGHLTFELWSVLAGQVLASRRVPWQKIRVLAIAGAIGIVAGYSLDPVTPIIKRICTSSFVIVSGGWCLLALAFSYWLIDVLGWKRWAIFFNIVGMNSLAIYLFTNTGGAE